MKTSLFSALLVSVVLLGCSHEPVRKTHTDAAEPTTDSRSEPSIKKVQDLYEHAQYREALVQLDSIPEKNVAPSEKTEYHNLRGLLLLAQKKPVQAQGAFRKALSTNQTPEYRGYFQYNLATALYEADQTKEASDLLNAIDQKSVDSAQQKKVQVLKEKIAATEKKPFKTTEETASTPVTVAAVGASVAASIPGSSSVPTPTPFPAIDAYHGPVNSHRIGLLLPLSGKYETFGKRAQKAIELAFQHASDSHAKDYELIAEDSGDSPETHLKALKKLVEEQQVVAVIGPLLSKGIETLAANAAYYQVPLISIAQVQGPVAADLFSCSISTNNQISRIVEYAMKSRGFSKFAILAPSNKVGEEMAHTFWDEVETRHGEIKAFELYDPEITDFRKPVDKSLGLFYTDARSDEIRDLAEKRKEMNITKKTMKTVQYFELNPIVDFDAVFIADDAKVVGQIIPTFTYRNAKDLAYLGITTWNSPQLIQRAQEQAEGATFPVAFNTLSPPVPTKAFYDLFVATYSSYPGEFDAIAFDAASLALKILQTSPSSREDFRLAVEKLNHVEGATGEVSIKDHRCVRDLALYTVQKGQFTVVDENATPVTKPKKAADEKTNPPQKPTNQ